MRTSSLAWRGSPLLWVPLETQLHKGMEVGREGTTVGVAPRGGGLSIRVVGPSGAGALTDPRVSSRAGGLHGQLLWGDGGGVQQTGAGPVQLLQQQLKREDHEEDRGEEEVWREKSIEEQNIYLSE